jgi:hypothetical protein
LFSVSSAEWRQEAYGGLELALHHPLLRFIVTGYPSVQVFIGHSRHVVTNRHGVLETTVLSFQIIAAS